jgi:hypothetical protein
MRKPIAPVTFALALLIEATVGSAPASAHDESTGHPSRRAGSRVDVERDMGREIRILGAELQALRVAIGRAGQPEHLARANASSPRRSSQPDAELGRQPRCLENAGGPVWWLEPMGLCATFRAITARAVTTAR